MSGRYLYKYVSFDEDMLVMNMIDKYLIMFSPPHKFNDPFDCNPRYVDSKNPKVLRPELFKSIHQKNLSPSQNRTLREQAINRMSTGLRDGSMRDLTLADVGIVSLSRTPWSVLMWSHYAEKHTGFMVEFKERTVFTKDQNGTEDKWLVTFEVEYVDERPSVSYWGRTEEEEVYKIFNYKSKEWEYEQEERVIKYVGGAGPFPYEPELLANVVAGSNISLEHFRILSDAIKRANKNRTHKIGLYRAEIDPAKYKLNIPGFRRPRPTPGL
jgi:hypothetical protein